MPLEAALEAAAVQRGAHSLKQTAGLVYVAPAAGSGRGLGRRGRPVKTQKKQNTENK